ncbi:MAG: 16S rRNA (cytosine(967)-C(5))-methyltransferase RsmB [Acetatifactor sp.]|nr:16S rRNA (cytosine(967)-C(5))-methyltransferase RsmB [Acetatifactor sp.]
MENVREIVLDVLLTLEKDGGMSHRLIGNVLNKYDYLDAKDKRFIKRVAEGTLERRMELDYYLDHFSSLPVRKMKPLIRNLLRMSAYQILFMDAVPDSAVCNEACKLAERRKFQNLKGFVNGVLRKVSREKESLPLPDRKKDFIQFLCVKYSMPEVITKAWISEYGEALTEKILQGLLEIHPVSLRVDESLSGAEATKIKERIEKGGAKAEVSPYDARILLARDLEGAESLPDFCDGKLTVQDASSVLAVKMAGIRKGDLVVDACASPGGKSILASELTGEEGRVICGDVSSQKTGKILENVARMGRNNIEVRVWDAREPETDLIGKADVLLLDVPCSGLGVIGKKRDVKYHVTEEGLSGLDELQKEILDGATRYVKPGGILLYSTCTIRSRENRDAVRWILENLPFEPVSVEAELPAAVMAGVLEEKQAFRGEKTPWENCFAQILPGVLEMDGFFFAKFRRKMNADSGN